jgi:dihydroorotase
MEYAATHDLTVFLHSEDPSLRDAGTVHEGPVSARLGIPGIPEAAETVAVARDLALVACTGVRAHFCRLSTAHAIKMVARAQFDGLPVSADVSAHQLFLTDEDVATFDSNCHFRPPLRSSEDRDALRQGLCNGSIAAICSDHQPHENDAKEAPFPATEPGASTLETLLPLALRLQQSNTLGLSDVIALLTSGPGRIIGSSFGTLTPGSSADVCIFDPDYRWQLNEDTMLSRGHNTPFLNQEMIGLVTHTLLSGHLVYTHGG